MTLLTVFGFATLSIVGHLWQCKWCLKTLKRNDRPPTTGISVAEISNFSNFKGWNSQTSIIPAQIMLSKNTPNGPRAFSLLWATWIGINWWCQMLVFTRALASPVPLLPIVSAPWFVVRGDKHKAFMCLILQMKWDKLIAFQQQTDSKEFPIVSFSVWLVVRSCSLCNWSVIWGYVFGLKGPSMTVAASKGFVVAIEITGKNLINWQ